MRGDARASNLLRPHRVHNGEREGLHLCLRGSSKSCVIEKVAFAVQTPPLATCADRIPAACQMSKTPTLIWAQRVEKVFVTWECLATKEVNVTFSEGLLTVEGTLENGDVYKLENLPLFLEIEPDGSKWFKNDRCS